MCSQIIKKGFGVGVFLTMLGVGESEGVRGRNISITCFFTHPDIDQRRGWEWHVREGDTASNLFRENGNIRIDMAS